MPEPVLARHIIHVDMDAFYASIEQLDHPVLRGQPVIVGGSADERGVVSAASYEARKYGVRSAMAMAQAQRLCPEAVVLPVRMERYKAVSRIIQNVFLDYTDLVEPISLDEAFLDVGGSLRLFGSAVAIGHAIKSRIKQETQLTASVGVAGNKLLAKLASDHDKPDGFVVIDDREAEAFLAGLSVRKLWGVGPKTTDKLTTLGIVRIRQLQQLSCQQLQQSFGEAMGEHLFAVSHGRDNSPVVAQRPAKSISSEETFSRDTVDTEQLTQSLWAHCESVGRRLRKHCLSGRTVTLKLRFSDFSLITRSETLPQPTNLDSEIFRTAQTLLQQAFSPYRPVRLLGVGVSQLAADSARPQQMLLFDDERLKQTELHRAVDRVRDRFGSDALKRGRTIQS